MEQDGTTTVRHENEIDDETCLKFVQACLRHLNVKSDKLQVQLNDRKRHLTAFTDTMEQAIEQFVQEHGIAQSQLTIEAQIKIVEYDYNERIVELEYLQLKPKEYQVRWTVCCSLDRRSTFVFSLI